MVEITPQDALERVRQKHGEDPFTGVAPVEVVHFDWEVDLSRDDSEDEIALEQLTDDEARRRVGRIPCEALYYLLVAKLGKQWWMHEWEVLVEELAKDNYFFDGPGHSKLMALWCLLRAPLHNNPFYRDWNSFLFMTCALMGRPVKWGEMCVPTPVEIAIAAHIALEFRPHGFSDQVMGAIASCCLYHGTWCLPEILAMAQDAVYQNLQYLRIPVGRSDVDAVQKRVIGLLIDQKGSDDAADPDEEGISERELITRIQVIRVLDFHERFNQLYHRGEVARELVLEKLSEQIAEAMR